MVAKMIEIVKKYGLTSANKAERLERKMGVEGSREERCEIIKQYNKNNLPVFRQVVLGYTAYFTLMVMVAVFLEPSVALAVIFTVPFLPLTAVTLPLELTVAIFVLLDVQVSLVFAFPF